LEKIRQALLNQEAIHVEMVNYRKDGSEFWVDMTGAPIINKNNELTHFVSIERDVTKHKQLETALLQAQKMEAVGLLARGFAHDFNNVLTVIISYSDLLLHYFNEEDKIRQYVEPIYTAGKQASELTHQLLALSRQQVLKPEEVNLNQIIMEVETMIRRSIGEDIQFTTLLTPELGSIEADLRQLSQVIMNLAVNARDAMPQGGILTIQTENIVLEKKECRISPELGTGEFIKLTVSDTGRGMDGDTVKRIFDPFFTTKEAGPRAGLGLSTVYSIVAQSNGGIIVHSEIGHGTSFEILLPRIYQGDKTKNTKSELAQQQRQGHEIILLVADDGNVRDLLHQGLKDQGYKILVASGGEDAIKLCQRHVGAIDLLLTDVVMPDICGPELAQHLHPFFPNMKVLYMTGCTDAVLARHGLDAAAINLLQKPVTIGTLAGKVRQLFANPPKQDNPPQPL
jgi:signal transduction histidine kinase/ActR/RegA family two-component response regulator